MAIEWGGPISLSVFIPFEMGTLEGTQCRSHIHDFMRNHTKAPNSAPLIVSTLYANSPIANSSCIIPPVNVRRGMENKVALAQYKARGGAAGALLESEVVPHRSSAIRKHANKSTIKHREPGTS